MSGLGDFVEENTEELHLMNIEHEDEFGKPIIHTLTRDKEGEQRHVEIVGHKPSFYIPEDAYSKRVANNDWVDYAEEGHQSIKGQSLVKVYCNLPGQINGKNDKKGLREYFDKTWEADVFYVNRFLIDTGIKTHFEVDLDETWEPQSCQGDYRVNVDDVTPVEEPTWKADPRTVTIDIEVESPDGFPDPSDADHPVTAITAHDSHTDAYTVWVLRHPDWDYSDVEVENLVIDHRPETISVEIDEDDDGEPIYEDLTVPIEDVKVFSDEGDMRHNFNKYVEARRPDLLSGWNSSCTDKGKPFDFPYLINRCQSKNDLSYRDWSPFGEVWDSHWGPRAKGVEFHDQMKAYKKTRWSKPKGGYGLKNISSEELPIGKLEMEDIDDAWKRDPAAFIEYNIRDVQAVLGIDVAAGVTDLFQNLRKLTGAQWGDCHNNIDLLDHYILRFAHERNVALPTNEKPERGWFYGGYVFEPELGRHPNAVYPDVWSEYPNAFRTCNLSPETIIGTAEDLEASEYTEEDCRWSYIDTRPDNVKNPPDMDGAAEPEYEKCYYLKPEIKEGFMNKVVDHVMGLKDDYDGTDLYGPVKQVVNSVWGVYGDSDSYGKGYRLFDWRVAESITLYGRKVIQHSAEKYVNSLNELKDKYDYDGRNAYQVGGDTDSVMTSIPFMNASNRDEQQQIVDLAIEACDMVNDSYDEFAAEEFNSDGTYIELEIESYSPWLFVPEGVTKEKAKKRYAEITAWDEGEWLDPPELSFTGIDVVRSDRAVVTREMVSDVIETILRIDDGEEARREAYDAIQNTVEQIKDGEKPLSYIARPKGMGQDPSEYGSASKRPSSTYRGAKYANENFDWEQMGEGSKPQFLAIDKVRGDWPKTYSAETAEDGDVVDALSVEHPERVPDEFIVDYDTMIEKTLRDPLRPIMGPLNWSFDEALSDSEQSDITSFM
ncbi:DNA polymerase domain-containing protein [Natrinema sp. DC36]|uniref:DNA polymerase domain-containing protein n=1 Tax=Natrinema sp. DC36 TaxID=2878680 RepID=UPI001CEFC7C6|nr:DNA polymerase domain-containing protein [Natrinema sp. DC36]